MGLVSTWLNGIGLSSAVATFQAAGIVTPAALAELDVAHFEALGVSDPDDRRKLFYLVQRIKMAVSKDKKESVEEQVDAVISSTVPHDDDASEKKDERHTAATSRNRQMQHDHQANTVLESNGDLRRSRRLASKQEENPSSSKENQSLQSPAKPPGRGVEQRGATAPKSKTQASNKKDEDIDHLPKEEAKDSSPKARQTRQSKRRGITSSKANAVFNFADEDERVAEELAPVRISPPSRTSGLKKPTPINTSTSGSDGGSTSSDSVNKVQSPKSKSVKDRPLESKLQNPGKSLRTGKCLSAIPSQEVAPMSPLMDIPTRSFMDINQENNHSRRDSADSYCSGKLDDLLQSSGSDIDAEQGTLSDQDSVSIAPQSKPRTRPKSIGGSETSSRSKPRTNARNLSISQADPTGSTGSNRRKSEDIRKTFLASHPQSSHKLTTRATPFVQGGTHSESWATRVAHLREDNNAEHNLFRHQEDQQIYEYDMRIRVIVRKRPVNKVEASLSGGVDVIHPLDFGDYGKILVYQPKTRVDLTKEMETIPFAFDNVYDEVSTNLQIYQRSLRNLIQPFFRGQWSTVFAYGQTGSG